MNDSQEKLLEKLAQDFEAQRRVGFESTLERARIISRIKDKVFSGNSSAAQAWCEKNLRNCGYRSFYSYLNGLIVYEGLTEIVHQGCTLKLPLDLAKLNALAQFRIKGNLQGEIDFPRIVKFLEKHDADILSREELRALLDNLLKKAKPAAQQLDFFAELNLPDPDTLETNILKRLDAVQPDTAASFGLVFLQGSFLTRERLVDQDVRDIISEIREQARQWSLYADQKGIAL